MPFAISERLLAVGDARRRRRGSRAPTASSGAACGRQLDEVAGEARGRRSPATLDSPAPPAGSRRRRGRRPARRRARLRVGGLEVRRVAVPPAAVEAPHVAHDELGLVVERPQVRLAQQVVGRPDRRARSRRASPRRSSSPARRRPGARALSAAVVEHAADALAAGDRQAVGRQQQLGLVRGHLAQRDGPLVRVALHLLRVAGVGEVPDERSRRRTARAARASTPTCGRRSRRGRGAARSSSPPTSTVEVGRA